MWQRLSLTAKLFVAIAASLLLVVFVIAAALTVQMRAGFTTYLLNAELGRLDQLHDTLEDADDARQGWPSLSGDGAWTDLVRRTSRPAGPPDRPLPPLRPAIEGTDGGPPPPPFRHDPLHLEDRLVLEDGAGQPVAGREDRSGKSVARVLVGPDGTTLGRLRLYEPRGVGAPVDLVFGAMQLRTFGLILGLAVLLSGFVAWLLARQASRPIRQIGASVSRLAAGDYAARIPVTRFDEVGQLMRDHNALAESLEWARRREREWITDASHELKTPLAILRAEIEAMQDGIRQPTADTLARLHATVMRLSRLVSDLNLSMGDARVTADNVRLDLASLVQNALTDSAIRMEELGLTIDIRIAGPVLVHGDPGRLRQVVDNLLENTGRYTQAPGCIRITCEARDEMAVLVLEDTPPCPANEALPRLFDRFFRGEASRARTLGGSGLGLAICRSIVETHHGRIGAERSDMGGLKITVELPLATQAPHG